MSCQRIAHIHYTLSAHSSYRIKILSSLSICLGGFVFSRQPSFRPKNGTRAIPNSTFQFENRSQCEWSNEKLHSIGSRGS